MKTDLNIRAVPVEKLKPAAYNPRVDLKPGDPAYEKIRRSLHDFGYVDPIIWNEVTGNVVGGHQRLKVLLADGAQEIMCVVLHIENLDDEKALNVALNKAVGEWDEQPLADLLRELQDAGYDMSATAFDQDEIDLLLAGQNAAVKDDDTQLDARTIRAFVQPGDLWYLGEHRMLCGDATNPRDIGRLMGDVKANLVLTDPPYNVAYESADGKTIQNDSMEDKRFHAFLLAAFINWVPHLAEGATAYVFHADSEGLNFRTALQEAGFILGGCCVWVKDSLVLGRSPYQWQHEPVLYGWLPNGGHEWFAQEEQSTVWRFDKPKRSREHPTMKPVPLLAHPINNSCEPNAVVLDTFGGSGSTLIACQQTGRVCFTMELDERYASVIVQRYVDFMSSHKDVYVQRGGRTMSYGEVVLREALNEL